MIPVNIPQLQDKELYEVLRKLALLATQFSDLIAVGSTYPTSGKRKFFWHETDEQLYFWTGNKWIMIG